MTSKLPVIQVIVTFFLTVLLASCGDHYENDWLKRGFVTPPDSAKPGVYWYFMEGNMNKEGITRDLESMKEAGIRYAVFLEVNVGIPKGKIEFMSNEWIDLFTHAVREAERLGINIILGSGPGWTGSGGPWVKPEESMMHIVCADTILTGPSIFDATLPLPLPRKPFFGEQSLTPELKKFRDNWYEDVRVLAFPAIEEKNSIENLDEKAFYYRAPYTSQPGVVPFILPVEADTAGKESFLKKDKIIDLTPLLQPGGRLSWNVPFGRWTVVRFGKRNNGSVTRPAPQQGLGFESDKFDTTALANHYRQYIGKLVEKVKPNKKPSGGGWTMLHIDSWEMGAQNWSHRFIDEFINRRGYDPVLYLPIFAGYIVNSRDESERFLWDVRQTVSELIIENHAEYFKTLGRRDGFTLSIEPYDMTPVSDFDFGAVADVPMGEFWAQGHGFNSAYSCLEATSIGHVTGKNIIAAEAFTADYTEAWKKCPGNMKNQTDWALALGINRFVFHAFAHKPHGDNLLPGMTMGPYGVHWDRGQTWWPMVAAYHNYLSRCQYMLMHGIPVADILFLLPEGAPNVFVPPVSALGGTDTLPDKKSYSFDACSPSYLINNASVVDNKIIFPSGVSYRILILPDIDEITPELAEKINFLLQNGASIAGIRAIKSPSLSGYPECDNKLNQITQIVWGINWEQERSRIKRINGTFFKLYKDTDEKASGGKSNEKMFDFYPPYDTIASFLKKLNVEPDFISSGNIRYHHRKLPDRDIYFISNRTGEKITDTCRFRDGTSQAELWNPLTGEIKMSLNITTSEKGATLPVILEPYGSIFVVFYKDEKDKEERTVKSVTGNDFPDKDEVMEITGPWEVTFDPARGGPGEVIFDSLYDWSTSGESGIKYYSGVAEYRCTFSFPEGSFNKKKNRYFLNTGKINNIARIKVNGREAGILWTDPWELDITSFIKKKDNLLEIEVANLWINRLIGDEQEPWDGIEGGHWPAWLESGSPRPTNRIAFTTHRFWKKDDPLVPSGLIGPVKIVNLPVKIK
ncbi:MAG: glycosyl hydrolase [Bacteroidales bacterium]|nr:glycosyl hydrolase [Bacteroidales bacterium]